MKGPSALSNLQQSKIKSANRKGKLLAPAHEGEANFGYFGTRPGPGYCISIFDFRQLRPMSPRR